MGTSSVRLRRGISAAVLACFCVFGSVATTVAQGSAASQDTVIASGVLTNAQGQADRNGEVYVLALPDQSDMLGAASGKWFSFTLVGSARTNAQGAYIVNVSPGTLMSTDGRHGYLNLQVIAVSEGAVMQFAYSVAYTGQSWRVESGAKVTPYTSFNFAARTVTSTPAAAALAAGSSTPSPAVAMKPDAPAEATVSAASVTPMTPSTPTASLQQLRQATQFASAGPSRPAAASCFYQWGTIYYNISEHFTNANTYGGSIPATVTEGTNSSTTATLGIAYSYSGASGTWSASGTSSITDSSTGGVSIAYSSTHTVYNRVNDRDLRNSCGAGIYREPWSFYDLLTTDGGSTGITWEYNCGTHAAGTSWFTGTATDATLNGGVSLGVLNVSAQQGYGSSIQIQYQFNVSGEVCGNSSSGPLQSSIVEADPF
jgi:hypothetical protein